jgi:hypothetical protein
MAAGNETQKDQNKVQGKEVKSKSDRFRALATTRTNAVLDKLALLENCANTSSYKYTEDQVDKIISAIQERVSDLEQSFYSGGASQGGVEL